MDVYYNANFGCIVCPQTTVGNTPMRGRSKETEIVSHVYQDGEGTMEVLCRVEHTLPPETREAARVECQALIRSILIRPCLKNAETPRRRIFFRHSALNFLAGRQPACENLP